MNLKIYQSYYKPEHLDHLDTEFCHINNANSPLAHLCEYPIHLACYEKSVRENIDVWGLLSWKWKQKMAGLTSHKLIQFINNNPGYDIYFFNPAAEPDSISYNIWEQGSWIHPEIILICEHLFPLMGIDVKTLYHPMSYSITCWASNYFGNKKFWDKWLAFAHSYVNAIPKLPADIKYKHDNLAKYKENKQLNYFPFIYERLFSTFLLLNHHQFTIKYCNYGAETLEPIYQELSVLKHQAVELKDKSLLLKWYEKRVNNFAVTENLAAQWMQHVNWE